MATERQLLKANIWKFYLLRILTKFAFFAPIIVLFWQDNGLSLTEIMILQSIYSIAIVLMEVPTGYFADVFGRRKSLIHAGTFTGLGFFAYSLGSSFMHFAVAEILIAFGLALASGADTAFLYDTLKDLKQEKQFKKIWGNMFFYGLLVLAFSSIAGGYIGKINFRWTLSATAFFIALTIPIAFSMHEPRRHKKIFKKGYTYELYKILKYALVKNKKLRWLLIYSGLTYGLLQAVIWFYQPYFELGGLDIIYFGFVYAAFNIIAATTGKYAHILEGKLGEKFSLALIPLLIAVAYLLMGKFVFIFGFVFAFLHQFTRGFSKVVLADYINKLTKSEIRATVLSGANLLQRLAYALIIPFAGWYADIYTIPQTLTVLGVTTAAIGAVLLWILHSRKVI